jgi:hypothetical protein
MLHYPGKRFKTMLREMVSRCTFFTANCEPECVPKCWVFTAGSILFQKTSFNIQVDILSIFLLDLRTVKWLGNLKSKLGNGSEMCMLDARYMYRNSYICLGFQIYRVLCRKYE